jgi:hypothetical protein
MMVFSICAPAQALNIWRSRSVLPRPAALAATSVGEGQFAGPFLIGIASSLIFVYKKNLYYKIRHILYFVAE